MNENFAPIVVFTYLRLEKLKKLIRNLKSNFASKKSEIYIFSDNIIVFINKFSFNVMNL